MLAYGLLALLALALLAAQLGALTGRSPTDLGVKDGRLKPPSLTPNSVSSQAALYPEHPQRAYAAIDPLPLKSAGAEASLQSLSMLIKAMPGMTVVTQQPDYLYARSQTRWLKFVDDVEFWFNPESQVIDMRSASRLGRKDFGVNRQRLTAIRAAYMASP
jgi:uncharacterized protein (DUF1499 family)